MKKGKLGASSFPDSKWGVTDYTCTTLETFWTVVPLVRAVYQISLHYDNNGIIKQLTGKWILTAHICFHGFHWNSNTMEKIIKWKLFLRYPLLRLFNPVIPHFTVMQKSKNKSCIFFKARKKSMQEQQNKNQGSGRRGKKHFCGRIKNIKHQRFSPFVAENQWSRPARTVGRLILPCIFPGG